MSATESTLAKKLVTLKLELNDSILTQRLILEPLTEKNSHELAVIMANPQVNRWAKAISGKTVEGIQNAMEEYYKPIKPNYYAVIYTKSKDMVGFVGLERGSDGFFYIDIYIDPNHQRQRYASEAIIEGLGAYLRQHPEIKKIAAYIASSNTKSSSLANKLKNQAKELGVEPKIIEGVAAALWDSPFIRKLTYGCITAATVGLSFYWQYRKTMTPASLDTIYPKNYLLPKL